MSARHFGLSRRQASVGGGFGKPAGSHGSGTRAELNSLPPQSILHCEDISYPPLNVGSVIRDAILGSITGVLLAVALFILIFVRVG